jgi:hypothetical protein
MMRLFAVTLLLLVTFGFAKPILWVLAAVVVYFLLRYSDLPYRRYGKRADGDNEGYRAYRERRDNQARWERRYRRDPKAHARNSGPGRRN